MLTKAEVVWIDTRMSLRVVMLAGIEKVFPGTGRFTSVERLGTDAMGESAWHPASEAQEIYALEQCIAKLHREKKK